MGHDPNNGQGHIDGLDESEIITDEDRVILIDEEGEEYNFVLLALLEVEGQDYAVLGPEDQLTDPSLEEVELSFFRVSPGSAEGEERFEAVDDEVEFNKVQAACADLLGLNEDD